MITLWLSSNYLWIVMKFSSPTKWIIAPCDTRFSISSFVLWRQKNPIRNSLLRHHHHRCALCKCEWSNRGEIRSSSSQRIGREEVLRFQSPVYFQVRQSELITSIQTLTAPLKSSLLFRFFELPLTLHTMGTRFFR